MLPWLSWTLLGLVLARLSIAVVVTGTQGGVDNVGGFRPFRLEISDFQYAGPAFDLYIQALQEFQDVDETELLSYYQVAGVHGYPNTGYDGVSGSGSGVGFCEHFSILFPPWHRPYLALFERVLWDKAQEIASRYKGESLWIYQDAAETLRIPYWDWSLNSTIPDVASSPQLIINTPQGMRTVPNPLYSFRFHPVIPGDFPHQALAKYPLTVRSPIGDSNESSNSASNAVLQKNAAFFHDSIYSLFSSETDFQPFSNAGDRPGGWNSLENIHNAIHQWVGGFGGHMTYLPYGSFDPIFWLHHANVDRLFAIWQALNPYSYVTPQITQVGTYSIKSGATETMETPLYPFRSDAHGNFHTAASVRHIRAFGYTYPELIDWALTGPELTANVRRIINYLYHPSPISKRAIIGGHHNAQLGAALAANYQWTLNIKVERTQLPDSLSIHFFLSTPPSSPSTWSTAPDLVGTQPVLISMAASSPSAISVGSIQLTHCLIALPSLDHDTVTTFLDANLYWAAQFKNGSAYGDSGAMMGAVQVELMARTVQQTASEMEFPRYGDWIGFGKVRLGWNGGRVFGRGLG